MHTHTHTHTHTQGLRVGITAIFRPGALALSCFLANAIGSATESATVTAFLCDVATATFYGQLGTENGTDCGNTKGGGVRAQIEHMCWGAIQ